MLWTARGEDAGREDLWEAKWIDRHFLGENSILRANM